MTKKKLSNQSANLLNFIALLPLACAALVFNSWPIQAFAQLSASDLEEELPLPEDLITPGWSDPAADFGIKLDGAASYSSVVVGEIDSESGADVAISTAKGTVHVINSNGTLSWKANTPITGCSFTQNKNKVYSSVAIGDLQGDGIPDLVVGYGGLNAQKCGGGLVAFSGHTGEQLWHLDLAKFSKSQKFWAINHSVFSTPALADIDGDGKLEIGFGSFDRNVYLVNHDGTVRWYYNAADTVWSSPTLYNIDSDPGLELLIGTDISANKFLRPITKNGGYIYAFKSNLSTANKKPVKYQFRDKRAYSYQKYFDQVIFASPVVAEVLPDSSGPEIISTSGCYFPEASRKKNGAWVKILQASTGKVLKTINTSVCGWSQPAVGDINNDGLVDIVVSITGSTQLAGKGRSELTAFTPANGAQLWTTEIRYNPYAGHFTAPITADLNGDGSLEVIYPDGAELTVYDGASGAKLLALDIGSFGRGIPAVGDLLGNGKLSLVMATGSLYAFSGFTEALENTPGVHAPFAAPWPMHRGDAQRRGVAQQ